MIEFVRNIDFSPFFISLKTGIIASSIAFFLGTFLAYLSMTMKRKVRWVLDSILTLPLVLPPTVVGFFLLLIFSLKRPFGSYLYQKFDIKIVQSIYGCVIASFVVALPLMYRNARGAFEQIDTNLIYAGRTLGLSEAKIFWRIIIPSAFPGIISGGILAFARAIGEYGATSMIAGNILGKTRTMSTAIAYETSVGNYDKAGFWVALIVILSFLIIFGINMLYGIGTKHFKEWN